MSAVYVARSPSDISVSAGTRNQRCLQEIPATVDTTRHNRSKSSKCYCCRSVANIFRRYDFRRHETERLYSAYAFRSHFVDIRALGVLLTALFLSLAVVDFVSAARPTIDSVTNVGLGATTSVLLVVLHTRLVTRARLPLIAGAMVCVCLVFSAAAMLPVSRRSSRAQPAEGIWRICYTVLAASVLVPLRLYVAVGLAVLVCVAHGSVAAMTAVDGHTGLLSRQVNSLVIMQT